MILLVNTWTQKADFGGTARNRLSVFLSGARVT